MPWLFLQSLLLSLALSLALAAKWQIERVKAVVGAVLAGTGAALATAYIPADRVAVLALAQAAVSGALLLVMLLFLFYRDPERVPPGDEGAVLSPADGRVLYIKALPNGEAPTSYKQGFPFKLEELSGSSLLDEGCYMIGIAMNFLDVHVNRSPIRGDVAMSRLVPGSALSLKEPEAVATNTRVTTLIEGAGVTAAVIQITSRLVRRITPFISAGDCVEAGQRIGTITFGSQVDVLLPRRPGLKIECRPQQRVRAGETIIARHGSPRGSVEGG
jgi:phosphatidylserine decarboxylase